MSTSSALTVQITLPDGWEEIDLFDLPPLEDAVELRAALRAAGFGAFPTADDMAPVLLSAVLVEPPLPEFADEPPLIASVVIQSHLAEHTEPVTFVNDGEIVPDRAVSRRTIDIAGGDVTFLQVSYRVPYPDGSGHYSVVFTTPNLPLQEEVEFLFDSILATMSWVAAD